MANGDLLAKRQGSFGLGAQTASGTVRATAPAVWLNADSANIEFTPNVYERVNNIGANKIGIEQAGSDYAFSFSNAEVSVDELGYMLWLFMGSEAFTANIDPTPDEHVLSNVYDSKYFTVFKNFGGTFDATNNLVERLVGCRFDSLSIEQPRAGYAKVSGSGVGLKLEPETTVYSPSVSLGADDAPLSWAALQDGDFQLGWNGQALATVTAPTSVKIDLTREVAAQGANLNSNDFTEVVEGGRNCAFTVEMDLIEGDTDCDAAVAAAKGGQDVQLSLDWTTGTHSFTFLTSLARITNSPSGEIGTSTDSQTLTVEAECFDTGTGIFSATVNADGTGSAYA